MTEDSRHPESPREKRRWRTVYAAVAAFAVATMLALEAFSRHFSG